MPKQHDFPFGIEFVTDILGLTQRYNERQRSFDIDCPFCGRHKKMNINREKDAFRCPACDAHGGMLKLYADLENLPDNKAAAEALLIAYGCEPSTRKAEIKKRAEETKALPPEINAASIEVRNDVYKSLLSKCSLSSRHRADLNKRGLSNEAIARYGFKSIPQAGLAYIAKKIVAEGNLCHGIPGFYVNKKGKVKIVPRTSGYFVPVVDLYGRISGMQIRNDNPPATSSEEVKKNFKKYVWFTSSDAERLGGNDGCSVSGIEQIHFVGINPEKPPEEVAITEGPLKADAAYELSGVPFIALTGVNNYSQLPTALKLLKSIGVKRVVECMDTDMFTNPNVMKGAMKIHELIEEAGLKAKRVKWDANYKGIDDMFLARAKKGKMNDKNKDN